MARYIDADALKDFPIRIDHYDRKNGNEHFVYGIETVIEYVDHLPTADVVKVVRCKDCDVPHNKWLGCPNLNGLIPPPDFYCAKGTPKESEVQGE